ncbi:MAG: acyl carrier protein [Oscillospiraceae bacterium]|jgi:acyl carrier protein|nr:acyl carrier protein [Oscillospiraceae bacterium]
MVTGKPCVGYVRKNILKARNKSMIFERVQKIICDQFDAEPEQVTEATSLEDVNADSLDLYDLAQSLEAAFDIQFQEEDLEEIKTIGDIVRFIENN